MSAGAGVYTCIGDSGARVGDHRVDEVGGVVFYVSVKVEVNK